ncbi:MAG: hypothetical protein ACLP0A_10170, partial [Verrucomicrobiia bacterium]
THPNLIPVGDCHRRSNTTDVYPLIYQCGEWQVKRSLKGQHGITVMNPKPQRHRGHGVPTSNGHEATRKRRRRQIGEGGINDLVETLMSLMPKGETTEF